jgi:hypothetical protein
LEVPSWDGLIAVDFPQINDFNGRLFLVGGVIRMSEVPPLLLIVIDEWKEWTSVERS